jgi:hypothetical protein
VRVWWRGTGAQVRAGRAQVRAGVRVRARRGVRGVPGAGAQRGGGAEQDRAVASPPPLAQHVRAGVAHRRLRPRRLQGHPARHRHRRPAHRLPREQSQVRARNTETCRSIRVAMRLRMIDRSIWHA